MCAGPGRAPSGATRQRSKAGWACRSCALRRRRPSTTHASGSPWHGWAAARSETPPLPRPLGQGYDEVVISTSAVDAYIEKNSKRFIDELKELCSFPSISNHGRDAIQPARDWLATRLAKFTDRVETLEAGGLAPLDPHVPRDGFAEHLLYQHYDVQPVDPIDLWQS